MLPNFSRLHIDSRSGSCSSSYVRRRSATTGQFCALTEDKAAELNGDGRGDPITFDDLLPNRQRQDDNATFCVRNRNPKDDGSYDYTYYNASTLWQWARGNAKLPLTGDDIWKEDWWMLRDRYDPDMLAPAWVRELPMLDPNTPDGRDLLYLDPESESEYEEEEEEYNGSEPQWSASDVDDELAVLAGWLIEADTAIKRSNEMEEGYGMTAALKCFQECEAQSDKIIEHTQIEDPEGSDGEYEELLLRVLKADRSMFSDIVNMWMKEDDEEDLDLRVVLTPAEASAFRNQGRGILLTFLARLLAFRIEYDGTPTVNERQSEYVAVLRAWDLRSEIRKSVDHFLTNANVENSELGGFQDARQDRRVRDGTALLHFTKWGDFVPRDGNMFYQLSKMMVMRTPRPMVEGSRHQQRVLTALSDKVSGLVVALSELDGNVIVSQMDAKYKWFVNEIGEVEKRMLATSGFPYTQSRIAIAVLVWIIMLDVCDKRRNIRSNPDEFVQDDRFVDLSRHLMLLAKTCAGVADPFLTTGSPVSSDALDNFFWKFVAIEYEEWPYDMVPYYKVKWAVQQAQTYWRGLEMGLAVVRPRPIDGEATPNRRRPRRG